jgi:hypothetical protein
VAQLYRPTPKNFFSELRRRNVYKVAVAYVVGGWPLAHGLAQVLPVFSVPNWVIQLFVLLIILGLPVALGLLRGLLEQAETGYEETLRLDCFFDTLQRVAEPLNQHRQWEIDPNYRFAVGCRFDLNPAMPSILAQIYRDETINRWFRGQELAVVCAVHDRIIKLRSSR